MLPSNDRLDYLFEQYLNNSISDNELTELLGYIRNAETDDLLKGQIMDVFKEMSPQKELDLVDWDEMFASIIHKRPLAEKKKIRRFNSWKKVAAAALIIIVGGTAGYLFTRHPASHPNFANSNKAAGDILPGGNKATLTLSNGTKILLNNAHNGNLARLGGVQVIKVNNGLLAYKQEVTGGGVKSGDQKSEINTLTTPRGGQYRLTLSDGTRVWLNAASSIRYPAEFEGSERKVEVTGEAYFEVVSGSGRKVAVPFIVKVGGREVQVLGTHFNVNAYADDRDIKTTLLEGAVKIGSTRLKPGEQAIWDGNGKMKVKDKVNVKDVIAWKNGFFSFSNDNLVEVMKKLSRWYDVDVVYQSGVRNNQQFSGRIDRNLTLSQVLKGLELTNAHFKIEAGRKVEILP